MNKCHHCDSTDTYKCGLCGKYWCSKFLDIDGNHCEPCLDGDYPTGDLK